MNDSALKVQYQRNGGEYPEKMLQLPNKILARQSKYNLYMPNQAKCRNCNNLQDKNAQLFF